MSPTLPSQPPTQTHPQVTPTPYPPQPPTHTHPSVTPTPYPPQPPTHTHPSVTPTPYPPHTHTHTHPSLTPTPYPSQPPTHTHLSVKQTPCTPQLPTNTHPSVTQDTFEYNKVFIDYNSTSSSVVIKSEIVDECYKVANSQANFAVQLVRRCYSKTERATSNCAGMGKKALSPRRLAAIKEAIYSIYPVRPGEKEEEIWKMYRRTIDSSCHQLNRPRYSSLLRKLD